jgi:anti-sigma regulatory factor (Ser/Thr protein kinase)
MVRLSLSHSRSEIARLATWLDEQERLLPIPDDVAYAVRLCLEEALSNLVTHTSATSDGCDITIDLVRQGDVVVAEIEDPGPPFDPRAAPLPAPPKSLDDAMPGGLGILLMRSFASEIDYHALPGRNRLTLRFHPPVEAVTANDRTSP